MKEEEVLHEKERQKRLRKQKNEEIIEKEKSYATVISLNKLMQQKLRSKIDSVNKSKNLERDHMTMSRSQPAFNPPMVKS